MEKEAFDKKLQDLIDTFKKSIVSDKEVSNDVMQKLDKQADVVLADLFTRPKFFKRLS